MFRLQIAHKLLQDEKGTALVEYAIALLVVAAVSVVTFSTMGTQVQTNATNACNAIHGRTTAGC